MKKLFDRVFDGADEMFAMADTAIEETIAELGESHPMQMPNTAYNLSCFMAYLGKTITNLGELKAAYEEAKTWNKHDPRLGDAFSSGMATFMAAETIEACKYAKDPDPYKGEYHGHLTEDRKSVV